MLLCPRRFKHLPLCRGSSLARRRNAILFAFTNKEASYSQVTGGVVGPDKLSARNWLACWRSVSWIIRRIKLRTKPRKGTAHWQCAGYHK